MSHTIQLDNITKKLESSPPSLEELFMRHYGTADSTTEKTAGYMADSMPDNSAGDTEKGMTDSTTDSTAGGAK